MVVDRLEKVDHKLSYLNFCNIWFVPKSCIFSYVPYLNMGMSKLIFLILKVLPCDIEALKTSCSGIVME